MFSQFVFLYCDRAVLLVYLNFGSYDSAHLMEIVMLYPFGFLRVLHS